MTLLVGAFAVARLANSNVRRNTLPLLFQALKFSSIESNSQATSSPQNSQSTDSSTATPPSSTTTPSTPSTPLRPPHILPKSDKGFVKKLWDQHSPAGQRRRIESGERLFRAAQRRASDPFWFGIGRIPKGFRSTHALLTLHIWFLHRRLIVDPSDPHFNLLIQEEVFDVLWNDTKARIREGGAHEISVNKHLTEVQQLTFQFCTHLDHAYTEYGNDDKRRREEIAGAIWEHILVRDEGALDDHLRRLTAYVEYQFTNIILRLPDLYFSQGRIAWGDLPNFTGMNDNNGIPLAKEDSQLLRSMDEEGLPEGWLRVLTDAGEHYYWNAITNETRWDIAAENKENK